MAHQAHNIPWDVLASSMYWSPAGPFHGVAHDLYPSFKPDQGKRRTHFARAFAKIVDEHSECARKKYPEKYDPPRSTDVIIEEKTAAKVLSILRPWQQSLEERFIDREEKLSCSGKICGHFDNGGCRCPLLPHEHRIASAFCRPHGDAPCYQFLDIHFDGFYNLQVLKTKILYGEINPILWACAHPEVAIGTWWEVDECGCGVSDDQALNLIFGSDLFKFLVQLHTRHRERGIFLKVLECTQLTLFPGLHSSMGPDLQEGLDGFHMLESHTLLPRNMGQVFWQRGDGRLSSLWDLPVCGPKIHSLQVGCTGIPAPLFLWDHRGPVQRYG